MSTKIVQVKPLTLDSNIGTSNTTAIVSGMIGLDGADLTQADFGTIIYGTFEPNTTREEAVSFTITSNTAGVANIDFGVSGRGLIGKSPYGTGGIAYSHSAGAKLVISNNPNLFNKFTAKDNDETVTGAWQFPTPTLDTNPATKGYADIALATKVGKTGNETIAGIKTFSSSPIVPTPTTDMQASTKKYVDDKAVALTGDQTVAGIKTFSSSPIVPTATTATQAVNKSQMEAYIAPLSGDIKASDTAYGTTKLDVAADTPSDPKALTATADRVSALSGDATPSAINKFLTKGKSVIAGATINGGTLPVPVYQNKSDNEFYACDANDTSAMKYTAFAISNGTDGAAINVQFSGIVSGFTGLLEGEKYYVQDTVGTIGTSIGTYEILVGIAISETELLIHKGPRRASGDGTSLGTASSSQVITCGFRPSKVRIDAAVGVTAGGEASTLKFIWNNGVANGLSVLLEGATPILQNSLRLYEGAAANYMTFSITSVTDTGFTITWTETGTFNPTSSGFVWEAEGEI